MLIAGLASLGVAVASLLLAGAAGEPYLDLGSLNPWIAVFALSLFCTLFAIPFAVNQMLVQARPDRAEGWEPAMVIWGGVATLALVVGGLLVFGGGFSPSSSLADAAGLLLVLEAGTVVVALLSWLILG